MDEDVRAAAAVALGSIASRSRQMTLSAVLRAVFINTSESEVVREAACRSFLYSQHIGLSERQKITLDEAAEMSFDPMQ